MTTLKPCPCGEVPRVRSLVIECHVGAMWGTVYPRSCCSAWSIAFRNNYERDPGKIQNLATQAWNAAPRAEGQ
jgi:hypothetical protein